MKKQTRIKYLYPNIKDERKYKWLENANFQYGILDYDITKLSLEEYQEKFGTNGNYDFWKKHSKKIWELETTTVQWSNEQVDELTNYLIENPLYLPYFIEHNGAGIIGRFIGQSFLFAESQKMPEKIGKGVWENQRINKEEYKKENFKAKYSLSLFLRVINHLLDAGINLDELYFVNLEENNTFHKMKNAHAWNANLLKNIKEQDYIRKDGHSFAQAEMKSILNYTNLNEFLDRVIQLTEIEHYIEFIEEGITMDPEAIVPFKGYHKMDMSYYKETGVVEVKDICKKIQEKLKKVSKETEITLSKEKLEEIENLKNLTLAGNYEVVIPRFKKFIEENEFLTPEQQSFLQELESILNKAGIQMNKARKTEEHTKKLEEVNQQLEELKRVNQELEESLSKSDERNRSLKKQLREYRREKETIRQETALKEKEYKEKITEMTSNNRMKTLKHLVTGFIFGAAVGCLACVPYCLNKKPLAKQVVEEEQEELKEMEIEETSKTYIKK